MCAQREGDACHCCVNSCLLSPPVACLPSDDGQSFVCNWVIIDGVNYTVSEDGGDEMPGGCEGRVV